MAILRDGQDPSGYLGVVPTEHPKNIVAQRAPTSNDRRYKIGTLWIDKSNNASYQLTSVAASSANWQVLGSDTGAVATITGDSGGALSPASGNINILGTSADGLSFAGSGSTLTGSIAAATNSQRGTIETATDAEAQAKTSTAAALTPSNLAADGFLQWVDVTLTSTEIKNLTTAQKELVAAPAAGKVLVFRGASLKLNYGGNNAFTESGDNFAVKYTDASGAQVSQDIETTGFIDQTADTYTNAEPKIDAIVAATGAEAQALVLDNLNADIAGNAADDNTITMRVYYVVETL